MLDVREQVSDTSYYRDENRVELKDSYNYKASISSVLRPVISVMSSIA